MTSSPLIRPFRNCDPPAIRELWQSQPVLDRRARVVSLDVLDRLVFAKPYFDRYGLLLAECDGRLEGMVHAGFAPDADGARLDYSQGVVCALVLRDPPRVEIGERLLHSAEAYLSARGARTIWGGGYSGGMPFYLGMYGNSPCGGLQPGDDAALAVYSQVGYRLHQTLQLWSRPLDSFRPPVSRELMAVRRAFDVTCDHDPQHSSWWDACLLGAHDRKRFQLRDKSNQQRAASVELWELEPLSSSWNLRALGMLPLIVEASYPAGQCGLFLVAEAMRQCANLGFSAVETTLPLDAADDVQVGIVNSLNFVPCGRASILLKQLG